MAQPLLPIAHRTLSNGLRVVCAPRPSMHTAVAQLTVPAGPRYETPATNGICHMIEHMLFRGTPTYPSAHEQAQAIERLGGTLAGSTFVDHGTMTLLSPPENFARAMAIFGELVCHPVLSDLETEKSIIREEALEDVDEDGQPIAPDDQVRALLLSPNPIAMPIVGSIRTINAIDKRQLRAHHARHYNASQSVLVLAGNVAAPACFHLAEEHLSGLSQDTVPDPPRLQAFVGPKVQFVDTAGSQTDIRLAFIAPSVRDPMEPAMEMLIRVLDDGMSTRLYSRISDERGLCYDVTADYRAMQDVGLVEFAASMQHERASEVVDELLTLLRELKTEGPTEQELEDARNRVRWDTESLLDDTLGVAEFLGRWERLGMETSLARRRMQLQRVTRDQVMEAAQTVFRQANMGIVGIGRLPRRHRRKLAASMAQLA